MNRLSLGLNSALVTLASLLAYSATAGVVSVTIKTPSGAAAEDAIVVFDPLDASPPPSHASDSIDQVNKRFVPRVKVIRTGTAVSFPNSDSIRHEVYSFSAPHPFKLKLYAGSPRVDVTFDKPGLVVLGCNIHDTMVAFLAVVDSPYFAKTSASGSANVTLPPGRYRLRVWQQKLNSAFPSRDITVGGEPSALPLTVDIDLSRDGAADWPN